MNDMQVMEALLELLENDHIQIRREPLDGQGSGLCVIGRQQVLFIDSQAPLADQCATCAEAVRASVDVETVYIRPQVREYIAEPSAAFGS